MRMNHQASSVLFGHTQYFTDDYDNHSVEMRGVGGFNTRTRRAVPGVVGLFGDDGPTLTGAASARQAIESLGSDMKLSLSTLSPTRPEWGKLSSLFVEYDAFEQEFEGWYAVIIQGLPGADDALKSLPNYQARYHAFRNRYTDLGFKPSQDLIDDQHASMNIKEIVTYAIIAVLAISLLPVVASKLL